MEINSTANHMWLTTSSKLNWLKCWWIQFQIYWNLMQYTSPKISIWHLIPSHFILVPSFQNQSSHWWPGIDPIVVTLLMLRLAGIVLCMSPANERLRYIVALPLIGWGHTQNDPWPGICLENKVNIMAADAVAPCVTRSAAAVVLTM